MFHQLFVKIHVLSFLFFVGRFLGMNGKKESCGVSSLIKSEKSQETRRLALERSGRARPPFLAVLDSYIYKYQYERFGVSRDRIDVAPPHDTSDMVPVAMFGNQPVVLHHQ